MNNVMFPEDQSSSFKLKATVQTYELSIADLAQLFSRELGVPVDRISIKDKARLQQGGPMGEATAVFDGVVITVKN